MVQVYKNREEKEGKDALYITGRPFYFALLILSFIFEISFTQWWRSW
jgi:hypothetical protein